MRARGMQVLTDNIKAVRPGVTIYGVGDDAHKTRVSGHNEDDTTGVRAEDQDSDSVPEHRAIDVMLGSSFNSADGQMLVDDLVLDVDNRARLIYVNWGNLQWARSNNWEPRDNSDDPHGHVHISGEADQDDNTNGWHLDRLSGGAAPGEPEKLVVDGVLGPKTIRRWQEVMGTKVDAMIDPERSALVVAVQTKLKATVDHRLVIDGQGIYQNNKIYKTAGALQRYLKTPVDLRISSPTSQVIKQLQRRLNENRF